MAAEPILLKLMFLKSSPNPGIFLSTNGEMLSTVTSLGDSPVPPVIMRISTALDDNAFFAILVIIGLESETSFRPSTRWPDVEANFSIMFADVSSGCWPVLRCLNFDVLHVRM